MPHLHDPAIRGPRCTWRVEDGEADRVSFREEDSMCVRVSLGKKKRPTETGRRSGHPGRKTRVWKPTNRDRKAFELTRVLSECYPAATSVSG